MEEYKDIKFIQDRTVVTKLLTRFITNDNEADFDMLLHKIWWGEHYRTLIQCSITKDTTKYIRKLIAVSGLVLLEEIDENEDEYTIEEFEIVAFSYVKTLGLETLLNMSNKGEKLTRVLQSM